MNCVAPLDVATPCRALKAQLMTAFTLTETLTGIGELLSHLVLTVTQPWTQAPLPLTRVVTVVRMQCLRGLSQPIRLAKQ